MEALFKKLLVGILLHALLWSGVKAADCVGLKFDLVDKKRFSEEIKSISPAEFKTHIFPLIEDKPSEMNILLAYCSFYKHDLKLAYELHTDAQLCGLIVTMRQEVAAISLEGLPGMSKINIYVKEWSQRLAHEPISFVTERYKRALDILQDEARTDDSWNSILAFKKFIEEKSDDERDRYVKSEKERIHGISHILKAEFDQWKHVCSACGRDTRCEWRKKD